MHIVELTDQEWDAALEKSPHAEVFHTSLWKNQVTASLGGVGHFYRYTSNIGDWLVPIYQGFPWSQTGFNLGTIGYGGPIPLRELEEAEVEIKSIKTIIRDFERKLSLTCTGFKSFPSLKWQVSNLSDGYTTTLTEVVPLDKNLEHVFNKTITGNVRTAIRRGLQQKLLVYEIVDQLEIDLACDLLAQTQVRVNASYITPKSFIKSLLNCSDFYMYGLKQANDLVAISLLLIYKKKAVHLFHGWKKELAIPGANQVIIWEMIKKSIESGCESFNMGESHTKELQIAKKRWGSISTPILKLVR